MATFDSDFIQVHLTIQTFNIPCKMVGLEWPPPERIYIDKGMWIR